MDTITLITAGSFLAVAVLTFVVGYVLLRVMPAIRADRLSVAAPASQAASSILRWDATPGTGWRGFVERLGTRLQPRRAALLVNYQARLWRAGFHDPRALAILFGTKVALAVAAAVAYALYGIIVQRALPNVLTVSLVLAALGFVAPDLWLVFRARQREQEMTNALPDVLDLMMVCVEAGLGFDAAIARITEQWQGSSGPLLEELKRMQLEMRAGRPREEALRAFAERVGTSEVKSVVTAFIQTDRLGTSLGKTLRIQAEASRIRRRHRAEGRAQLAPLKMLFPTILFLMPAFMMVAMAPALLRMLELMRSAGR